MNALHRLVHRDEPAPASTNAFTPLMFDLLIALFVTCMIGFCFIIYLLTLRLYRKRQLRKQGLPLHNPPASHSHSSRKSNHRRLTITAAPYGRNRSSSHSVFVYNEKQAFINNSTSPPPSPVPEIRITFPEEEDTSGKRLSGRVVVVRISDNGGVGLEPCEEEHLPPYQSSDADRFQSLDLERLGGLKEKEHGQRWS